jgi:hypothetical protein
MATTEMIYVSDSRYDSIASKIRATYPNSCVLWAEAVNNPVLRAAFEKRRDAIKLARGSVKVVELFHGTKEQSIQSIICNGFICGMNKVSAFGRGTYFATTATYSKSFMDVGRDGISYMFIADVLVGECTRGVQNGVLDTSTHDNFINTQYNPSIYVTPYDDGAYPGTIVAFHRDAK